MGVFVLSVNPASAEAFDLRGGVGFGGMLASNQPRLAISPHVAVSWTSEGGPMFAIREMLSFIPATSKDGMGIYSRTSADVGYSTSMMDLSGGPSISLYSMASCRNLLCGRANGLAVGGHVEASFFLLGPFGLSASASVDWITGGSLVMSEGIAAMIVAGPVIRWTRK